MTVASKGVSFCAMDDPSSATTPKMVGGRLKAKLRHAGMTQGELALRLHLDRTTVARYASGDLTMSITTLALIEAILECSPGELLRADEAVA